MNEPKISVIVPVYNTEKYVSRTLESIKDQTYKIIQLIIVNDASSDHSSNMIETFIEQNNDMEIHYINLKENVGVAWARQQALEKVNGDYVHMLDSDDYILPNTYADALLEIRNRGADVCYWGWQNVNENGSNLTNYLEDGFSFLNGIIDGYEACKQKISKKIWICMGNAIYSKKMIDSAKPIFFKGFNIGEDFYLINKILLNSHAVCCVPANNFCCTERKNSAIHSPFSSNDLQFLFLIEKLQKYIFEADNLESYNTKYLIRLLNLEYNRNVAVIRDKFIKSKLNVGTKIIFRELKQLNLKLYKLDMLLFVKIYGKKPLLKNCLFYVAPRSYIAAIKKLEIKKMSYNA